MKANKKITINEAQNYIDNMEVVNINTLSFTSEVLKESMEELLNNGFAIIISRVNWDKKVSYFKYVKDNKIAYCQTSYGELTISSEYIPSPFNGSGMIYGAPKGISCFYNAFNFGCGNRTDSPKPYENLAHYYAFPINRMLKQIKVIL